MSEAKPQLGDLDLGLYELTWSEVISMSVQLGMDFAVLRKIDESTNPNIRVLTAMDSWLKSDPNASWNKVVRALKAIKKDVLAQRLENTYDMTAPAGPSAAVTDDGAPGSFSPPRPPGTQHSSVSTSATPQASADQGLLTVMYEALIPAQNSSRFLGLKLGLPPHAVEAIHSQHRNPKDCLLQVLTEFLKQVDPDEAWSTVVAALRSRAVNLPRLAIEIEAQYCTSPSSHPSSSPSSLSSLLLTSQGDQTCSASRPTITQVEPASPTGPARSDTPTLPKLMRFPKKSGGHFNIITCIGPNHRMFGIFLLDDERGEITDAMFQSELGRPDAILQKIFSRWLQGTGRAPRSWETLVTVLEEMGVVGELASTVRENLR
ncbi:hypothetical protein GBAR_LOCUS6194 [Geodia barretti]|uniref:Death domain-containing protein n=1 Tax=Geodia barretti TaxID=519541 RepID=A0AA35WBY8_GEOBA|nr:hypothetical protein GBAR_LOCUS6194 [Geodia barretti]